MPEKIIDAARQILLEGNDIVTAEIISTTGSTPRHRGSLMVLAEDGRKLGTVGGGRIEAEVTDICRGAFDRDTEGHLHTIGITSQIDGGDDCDCGTADIMIRHYSKEHPEDFREISEPSSAAYIFGCGYVGAALEPVLRYVGFDTVMIDDRAEFASSEKFPYASDVIAVRSFTDIFREREMDENSYIFILSYSQMSNCDILREALKHQHAYIGLLGSRRKTANVFALLEWEGIQAAADDTVYAPIGDDISAESPEEIAVSIAAQVIRIRAEKRNSHG
ncbi:MAG: XdhC/CoxI family protein [Eubacteriaceae bacterium]|jgi:xanthine dehydrogenase accessory factor|nr:XdhC/CoxI family protein [Eubacteriaceae bacterium]